MHHADQLNVHRTEHAARQQRAAQYRATHIAPRGRNPLTTVPALIAAVALVSTIAVTGPAARATTDADADAPVVQVQADTYEAPATRLDSSKPDGFWSPSGTTTYPAGRVR